MNAIDLRKKFIDFFIKKNHHRIDSAPLVPENDPTVLFTTAGMHPLVPYLLGEKHPEGKRLVNVQKCLRTDDIDEVGDSTHNTFFEMLGNWSLGDYFKKEAIGYSYEFLTQELKMDPRKIAVTCFAGNDHAPKDTKSADIWKLMGIADERIAYLPDNWWGPAGIEGPCGPDTEMFYWNGKGDAPKTFDPSDNNWVEIWNDVFMQYNKLSSKIGGEFKYIELDQKNVDTGMGLERTLAILQNKDTIYETELFVPLIDAIQKLAKKPASTTGGYDKRLARIVADHIRASVFLIADGVRPSNVDQGYILRRLLRRVIRYADMMEFSDDTYLDILANVVIENYKSVYPEIDKKRHISEILFAEQEKFEKALEQGEKEFSKIVNVLKSHNQDMISGRVAFKLYESYGFPLELTKELAKEEDLEINEKEFNEAFEKHQLLSRKGAEKKFAGGLADHSEIAARYHTATHLLHEALRQVLGDHVAQKGSNITADRMRFDFNHPDKLMPVQIKKVEDIVNREIKAKLPITMTEMDLKEAHSSGAIGLFNSKYGKIVKVYTIGINDRDYFSREICGGPHAKNTSELGHFHIVKEESSSAGVRRIKAVLD